MKHALQRLPAEFAEVAFLIRDIRSISEAVSILPCLSSYARALPAKEAEEQRYLVLSQE